MAPLPKNLITHFTHPHPLSPADNDHEFRCDGCKTLGSGNRFRCHGCDFDLHEYCATCPRTLSAPSMHRHSLTLVIRKPPEKTTTTAAATHRVDRICDVCRDPVEGLFYRCKLCEFDVHPLCTQLPEKLNHALHHTHPLILKTSPAAGSCAVCSHPCSEWRYRCSFCSFDIHLGCVLKPVVRCPQELGQRQTGQRGIPVHGQGIPFRPPPQFAQFYGYPYGPYPYTPGYPNYGPGFGYYGGPYMYPPGNLGQQNLQVGGGGGGGGNSNAMSRVGRSMFALVGQLGFGVISNMVFGVDVSPLFAG